MALDPTTAVNIVGSKVTVAERWIKLYRKIHNLFLKRDFVNKDDFETAIQQINANFAQINKDLISLQTAIFTGHGHPTAALGPPSPGSVPMGPVTPPTGALPVKTTTVGAETLDSILQATGEPVVPVESPV